MDISVEITAKVVKCLGELRKDEELLDFTVKVGEAYFACHKVLLAACSKFFHGLLRSDMKETRDDCVTLHDITPNTFQLILDTIYNGVNVLTENNFIELWKAVHQLQIDFMIHLCENFALNVLSCKTVNVIYETAKYLDSEIISLEVLDFMAKNFNDFAKSKALVFYITSDELLSLIELDYLNVTSEDYLLEYVLSWIEFNFEHYFDLLPNSCYEKYESNRSSTEDDSEEESKNKSKTQMDRIKDKDSYEETFNKLDKKKESDVIVGLFKRVRMCLVSVSYLQQVYNNYFIKKNVKAKKIIFNAVLYQTQAYHHGQWPTAAIHRACSTLDHFGVASFNNGEVCVFSVYNSKWYNIAKLQYCSAKLKFVVFQNDLYAAGVGSYYRCSSSMSQLFILSNNTWERLLDIPGQDILLVSHENLIYIINQQDSSIYSLNPNTRSLIYQEFTKLPVNVKAENVISYEKYILVFSSVIQKGLQHTSVQKLDVHSKTWTKLDSFEGPAVEIISFKDDKFTYILQTNGCLWLIRCSLSGEVQFVFKSQLWNFHKRLYGALTYRDKLVIFGNDARDDPKGKIRAFSLSGFFSEIVHLGTKSESSNFTPVILPKQNLIPIVENT